MKTGTRIMVEEKLAKTWGFETPALGTVIGSDPDGSNKKVVAVELDQGPSLFECKGIHIERLKVIGNN